MSVFRKTSGTRTSRVLIALLCGTIAWAIYDISYGIFSTDTSVFFEKPIWIVIPQGATPNKVSRILSESRLLNRPRLFVYTAKILGLDKHIRAGKFRFDYPASIWKILKIVTRGGSFDVKVTIPEGLTIWHIAGIMQRELGIDSVRFVEACKNDSLLAQKGLSAPSFEGFLFPETYNIPLNTEPDSIISIMFNEFKARWKPEYAARAESIKISIRDVITLASIIEAEAHIKGEQPIISSVYHNRLSIGMMLQADPTTIYGLRKFDTPLLLEDLSDTSSYNTYRHKGLPPGPICNPGESAIRAALFPDTTEFLYFVSRRDGTHIFSKTLNEHNSAIQYVKKLAMQKNFDSKK